MLRFSLKTIFVLTAYAAVCLLLAIQIKWITGLWCFGVLAVDWVTREKKYTVMPGAALMMLLLTLGGPTWPGYDEEVLYTVMAFGAIVGGSLNAIVRGYVSLGLSMIGLILLSIACLFYFG